MVVDGVFVVNGPPNPTQPGTPYPESRFLIPVSETYKPSEESLVVSPGEVIRPEVARIPPGTD
jgi:hypothetical protein